MHNIVGASITTDQLSLRVQGRTFSYGVQFSLWDCEVSRAAVQAEDNVREYEDMGGSGSRDLGSG